MGRRWLVIGAALSACVTGACSLLYGLDGYVGEAGPPGDGGTGPLANDVVTADSPVAPGPDGAPPDASDGGPVIGCNAAQNDPSLLAYYAFDDGTGSTVKDCSGHGHDGTIVGTPGWTTGKYGGGLGFDGSGSCVDLGADPALRLGTFTVTAWANVTAYLSSGLNGQVLSKSSGNPNAIGWRFATVANPNLFELKLAVDGGPPFSLGTPGGQATAKWLHVAVVLVPGAHADIFVDGTRIANVASPPPIFEETGADMHIGCNGGAKDYFKGTLDELRIYTRALADSEIAALAR